MLLSLHDLSAITFFLFRQFSLENKQVAIWRVSEDLIFGEEYLPLLKLDMNPFIHIYCCYHYALHILHL